MPLLNRRTAIVLAASAMLLPGAALTAPLRVTLFKNPQCGCCEGYADYLRQSGFAVDVMSVNDLVTLARQKGVPEELDGCHISIIDGYVVIGHLPVDAVRKLLAERPRIVGLSIPGMPTGLPGMPGPRPEPIAIYEIAAAGGEPKVFMMAP